MLRLHARAKINWTLDIVGLRQDGYHQMDMLMESVELADTLDIRESDTIQLSIAGNECLSNVDNLVLRAALALRQSVGCAGGASLSLTKRIPVGAGMGGGSADAAAALIGLNAFWHAGKNLSELQEIGLTLGADVPFLLQGGLARVGGIGEEIHPLPQAKTATLLVIQPCQALSTRAVFQAYDAMPSPRHPDTERAQQALLIRDYAVFSGAAGNVLEAASAAYRPQIAEAVETLRAVNADYAAMTGSGSAVFGAFADEAEAWKAYRLLHKRWRRCWLTKTASQSVIWDET